MAERQPAWLERDLQRARDFDEIETSGHYRLESCATVTEYGEQLGYDARQVRRWTHVGLVLRLNPAIEAEIRGGSISLEKLDILAPIYRVPARQWEGDDWLGLAKFCTPRVLRRHVQRRIEEVAQRKTCQSRTLTASDDTWNDFARARDVASSLAGRALTEGETLDATVSEYLDRKDPLRRAERAKRRRPLDPVGKTGRKDRETTGRRPRRPPVDLEHLVWLRARGTCEFPGCRCRRGLQLCHVQPFAAGGPHDLRNLILLCATHHLLFDEGDLELLGWGEDGRPRFARRNLKARGPP